jgi:hypothetical protein
MDGRVDAADARFSELLLWADVNGNHRTDIGELSTLAARGVAGLSTRYVMAPEEQNGNWLLERGTATFADGRTVQLVDAYFRIDAPQADAAAIDHGATITVRSEMPQARSGTPDVFMGGAVFGRPAGAAAGAVVDWAASHRRIVDGTDVTTEEARKKKTSVRSWLADFLGIGNSGNGRGLSETTGLKVVLGDKAESRHVEADRTR